MRAGGAPWAPQLLAAALAAALLPRASGQTFSRGNVITVPTVAYISFAVVGFLLLIIMLLLKYRANVWRRREEERRAQQLQAEQKEAWEAANALREVHIPPIVLNPDCSFGLAEPDKQLAAPLPDAAPAASGPEQQAQQSQQQASQQQQQQSWRQQQGRQTQAAPQRAAQQPQPVQRSQRMQEGLPSGTVELQQLPPATQQAAQQPDGVAWPGATVYVRGSRAAFASASIQPPLV